jgi:multidrug efflux pump subunit AcrA (membrane-fusion protein)
VTPKISAPINEFHVNRGDHVTKGQLIAVLESRDLAAAVVEAKGMYEQAQASYRSTTAATLPDEIAKAQADVKSAKQALDAAQKMYESRKELRQQGALAQRLVDEANVAYVLANSQYDVALRHLTALEEVGKDAETRQAQAQVDSAKGHYDGAEAQLGYSKIYSPITGVITDRPLYAGEMANAGAPLLTVMDLSRVVVRANISSEQLPFLKVGDPATVATLDGSEELHGKVTVVSPALDPNSTTAEVRIEVANPGERLRPGVAIEVSILAETVKDAIVIPLAAVLPSAEGENIALVVGSDSLAHERKIETGIRETDKVQVLKGLEPGEQVIVVGGLGLEDKAKVRVEKAEVKSDKKSDEKTDKKTDEKTDEHD